MNILSNATLTLAVCRIPQVWWIRSRLHHRVLRGHAGVLGRHWITWMWILGGSQWFSISIVHGLHWVAGHGDLLGCMLKSKHCFKPEGFVVVCTSTDIKSTDLTIIRCPAPLLPSLVEVTAGAHEAADHRRDDGHKQEDGRGNAG